MKPITDYEHYSICPDGSVINHRTNRQLTPIVNKQTGYVQADLWKHNKGKRFYIHRLLALVYIPNPNNYPEVNHIDSNRANNALSNLEWVTSQQNSIHAVINGQRDHIPRMKLEYIRKAFTLVMEGHSYKEVSNILVNAWQPGFLSVKVKQYAKKINQETLLKEELYRQRVKRSLENLSKINC